MKILVTGATGRIGANLVMRLLDQGHSIRSFVYPGDASRAGKLDALANVETVFGDLRNPQDVENAVAGVDVVYHLAAAFGGPFDNRQYTAINVMGTLNLLESVREHCPDLHRFVYASTAGVYWSLREYGRYFERPIHEDQVVRRYPDMPYLMTKWLGEELAVAYHLQYALPVTVLRFSTVIEPGEFLNEQGWPKLFLYSTACERYRTETRADPAEQALLDDLLAGWDGQEKFLLSLNPNGVPYHEQFADVRDIVQGLDLSIRVDAAVGQIFNLSGAAIFDWGELVPRLAERYRLPVVEARLPYANYYEIDLGRIEKLLGFRPRHDFDSILATAEAIRRGETTDVVPGGIAYGAV